MVPINPVEDLIEDLLSEDDSLRNSAESRIKDFPVEDVIPEISLLLRSPQKNIRNRGMELFCCVGSDAVKYLAVLITDEEWTVRYRAAEALGVIGDDAASVLLIPALKDRKDHVRYMAAKGLGNLFHAKAADAVAPLLEDENEFVRASAARALGQMCLAAYVPLIEAALKREEYEKTRIVMEEALARLNGQYGGI